MDEDSSLLPALKRPPYLSSRDYLDPDDDYYEYLTCHADLAEIQWKMDFLPMPAIPTAPRAMLESSLAYGLLPGGPAAFNMNMMMMAVGGGDFDPSSLGPTTTDATMDMQASELVAPSSVYSEDIPTGPSGSFYDIYAAAAMYDQAASAAIAAAASAPSSSSTNTGTAYLPPSSTSSSSSSTHPHIPYGENGGDSGDSYPSHIPTTTTSSTSNTPTATTAPPLPLPRLPPNWRQATTEDGSVYYYHKITNKTQWSFPTEPPPQPQQQRSTPVGSSSIEGVDSARLEDVVNQAMIRKSHSPSVESISSPSSHPPSRLADTSSTNIILPSPTTKTAPGGGGGGGGGFAVGLDESELKKEIGKVVTRYLSSSSKQKALWQGDKHLFKELARKLTHHIVERESQSNRKIGGMTTSLRGKIEKFIDMHGASFVDKLKAKRSHS